MQGLTDLCAQAGLSVCWLIYLCVRLQRVRRRDAALSFFFLKSRLKSCQLTLSADGFNTLTLKVALAANGPPLGPYLLTYSPFISF